MGNNQNFNATTRRFSQYLTAVTKSADNSVAQIDLPQSGYLAAIDLLIIGTVTITSGTFTPDANRGAWNLINKIQLRTNEGADLWNTTGWQAYVYNQTLRSGFSAECRPAVTGGPTRNAYRSYLNNPVVGQTSSYNFILPLRLQLTWGEMLMAGLILLQNPGVRFTLSIGFGALSNVGTGGVATLSAVQVIPALDQYLVPQEDSNQPDLSLAKTVLGSVTSVPSVAGVFTYSPPRGNTYTRIIQQFIDGTSGPMGAAESGLSGPQVSNFGLVYSQTQNIINERVQQRLWRQRWIYGNDLPDGVYATELSLGNGVPEFPNGRDNIDTSEITDFSLNTTLTGTVAAGSTVETVAEQLVVVQA